MGVRVRPERPGGGEGVRVRPAVRLVLGRGSVELALGDDRGGGDGAIERRGDRRGPAARTAVRTRRHPRRHPGEGAQETWGPRRAAAAAGIRKRRRGSRVAKAKARGTHGRPPVDQRRGWHTDRLTARYRQRLRRGTDDGGGRGRARAGGAGGRRSSLRAAAAREGPARRVGPRGVRRRRRRVPRPARHVPVHVRT